MDKIEDQFLTWANGHLSLLDKMNIAADKALVIYRIGYLAALSSSDADQLKINQSWTPRANS